MTSICKYQNQIESMQNIALMLIDNPHPEVNLLRQRQITIDGYDLITMLNRDIVDGQIIETLEIVNYSAPYLPMHLLCKVAILFLGGHHLIYYSKYIESKRVYIWMVFLDSTGKPVASNLNNLKDLEYEGLRFSLAC